MDKFFIVLQEGVISVSRYENEEFEIIKHEGEVEQVYNSSSFWSWFKEKIEYEDEELSFVVVTDNKAFTIPPASGIKLNETNSFDNNSYIDDKIISLSKGMFVLSFPPRKETPKQIVEENKESSKIKVEELLSENEIANYFRKQTQSYHNE